MKADPSWIIANASIGRTMLGVEDHGLTTAFVHCDGDGWGQGFGGINFGSSTKHHACGTQFIRRVLDTVGKSDWEKLPGTSVRIARAKDYGPIIAIGHFYKDEWFCPSLEPHP